MVKNYLKTALRSLYKYKAFTVINIFGLSIGIAMATLMGRFIQEELSYDQFYQNKDRIYRVFQESKINGRERTGITGSGMLAPALEDYVPEVEVAGRTHRVGSAVVKHNEQQYVENLLAYADNGFINIMELEFLDGNPKEALSNPTDFVISASLAMKIFGSNDGLIGQAININDRPMQITGVYKDMPKNSHYTPRSGFISNTAMGQFSWNRVGHVTYVRLKEGTDPDNLTEKLSTIVDDNILDVLPEDAMVDIYFYPVPEIWLSGGEKQQSGGSKATIYSFALIAFFMLLLAAINYMNLATARSMRRAKEIGMRKVIGAKRYHVMLQFLVESVLICSFSVLVGGFLAEMCTSIFNDLTGKTVEIGFLQNPELLISLLVFGFILGILSGLYPAVFLSGFKPTRVLKTAATGSKSNRNVRRVLVTLQFVISVGLIISTLVVYKQITYLNTKDLGYNSEQVLAMRLAQADTSEVMKSAMLQLPQVSAITATNLMPATGDSGATFIIRDERGEEHRDILSMASIDYDYLSTMELDLVQGRNFSKEFATDINAILINQTMQAKYGWADPIGKTITINEEGPQTFTIIGVVEDFNMLSLYEPVKPFALFLKPQFDWGPQYLLAKLNVEDAATTIDQLKEVYESIEKNRPFGSTFIDDYFSRVYEAETKKAQVYLTFSIITIVIACIGLFGLATFVLQQKAKEISIRKVLGASMRDIIRLTSREFVIIILISSLIASPLAWYFLQDWLNTFQYRVNMDMLNILVAMIMALLLALITISIQSIRMARTNPAQTLNHE